MLLLRSSAPGSLGMETSTLQIEECTTPMRRCIANILGLRHPIPNALSQLSRHVISNKFPRLLAEREIIANAFVYQRCLEMAVAKSICKDTTIYSNERIFHRKTSIKPCLLDACKQLSQCLNTPYCTNA